MNNQIQFPIGFYSVRNSDRNFDIMSLHQSSNYIDNWNKKQTNSIMEFGQSQLNQQKIQEYFNLLFSPRTVTESLIRRNQFLQMKSFDNSDSQPDQLYNRRKVRVNNLKQKQNKKLMILSDIKNKQPDKFRAIAQFMKLFGQIKQKIKGIRHDYYSQKTFLTLKKASTQQLLKATKILSSLLTQVITHFHKFYYYYTDKQLQQKKIQYYIQFLIIPRFFISKQKLLKFINQQIIQQHFKFFIYHSCLGHYNNQANKKLPEQLQMKYVRQLMNDLNGKQKFKKICTINHGGHFYKKHGNLYYQLYFKSLDCLKNIDLLCKKNYTLEQLEYQFAKCENNCNSDKQGDKNIQNVDEAFILTWPTDMNDQKSVSNILKSSLPRQQSSPNLTKTVSSLNNSLTIQHNTNNTIQPSKFKLKRPQSLMTSSEIEQKPKLKIKKAFTLELGRQSNIIIVPPPEYSGESENL